MKDIFPPLSFLKSQWSFLLFGFMLAFFSSPGQTFFISLFSADIRAELNLSHGDFGTVYAIGTLASAACLVPAGRLVDVMRLRHIALIIITGLGLAAMFFSTITSVLTLCLAVFFLRFTGQGMMTHLYATAMSRRYVAERGRALAVSALGHPASEFAMPVFALAMLGLMEWRGVWQSVGVLALAIMVPLALFCTRRLKGQDGEGLEGAASAGRGGIHWSRADMLRHWRFWMLCGIAIAPAFTMTGLFFHQIHFAEIKNIPLPLWISGYAFYAVFNVIGSLIGGGITDRLSASVFAPIAVTNCALPAIVLYFIGAGAFVYFYFIVMGLVVGMLYASLTAVWAEIYGTKHIGSIRAVAMAISVFASALSPVLIGLMIDAGAGIGATMIALGAVPVIAGAMAMTAVRIK